MGALDADVDAILEAYRLHTHGRGPNVGEFVYYHHEKHGTLLGKVTAVHKDGRYTVHNARHGKHRIRDWNIHRVPTRREQRELSKIKREEGEQGYYAQSEMRGRLLPSSLWFEGDAQLEEVRLPFGPKARKRRARSATRIETTRGDLKRIKRGGRSIRTHYHHLGPEGRPRNVKLMHVTKLQHLAAHPKSTDVLRARVRDELRRRGEHVPKLREAGFAEAELQEAFRSHGYRRGDTVRQGQALFHVERTFGRHHLLLRYDRETTHGLQPPGWSPAWSERKRLIVDTRKFHPNMRDPHHRMREAHWAPGDDVDARALHDHQLVRAWRYHMARARQHEEIAGHELMLGHGPSDRHMHHGRLYHHHMQRASRIHTEYARRHGRGLEVITGIGRDQLNRHLGLKEGGLSEARWKGNLEHLKHRLQYHHDRSYSARDPERRAQHRAAYHRYVRHYLHALSDRSERRRRAEAKPTSAERDRYLRQRARFAAASLGSTPEHMWSQLEQRGAGMSSVMDTKEAMRPFVEARRRRRSGGNPQDFIGRSIRYHYPSYGGWLKGRIVKIEGNKVHVKPTHYIDGSETYPVGPLLRRRTHKIEHFWGRGGRGIEHTTIKLDEAALEAAFLEGCAKDPALVEARGGRGGASEAEMRAKAASYPAHAGGIGSGTPEPIGKGKGRVYPPGFQHIRNALIRSGHSVAVASMIAYGALRRWSRGGGKVKPETRAKAAAVLGQLHATGGASRAHTAGRRVIAAEAAPLAEVRRARFEDIQPGDTVTYHEPFAKTYPRRIERTARVIRHIRASRQLEVELHHRRAGLEGLRGKRTTIKPKQIKHAHSPDEVSFGGYEAADMSEVRRARFEHIQPGDTVTYREPAWKADHTKPDRGLIKTGIVIGHTRDRRLHLDLGHMRQGKTAKIKPHQIMHAHSPDEMPFGGYS